MYRYTEDEWRTLSILPLAFSATCGAILLLTSVWVGWSQKTDEGVKSLHKNRLFRCTFAIGWVLVGFAITWGVLVRINSACGVERGGYKVTKLVDGGHGMHLVINMTRLPFMSDAKSSTRSIPTDADKDEGPGGTLHLTVNGTESTKFFTKIETKGRSMQPQLPDSYTFDTQEKGEVIQSFFGMESLPKKCKKFVLRSGVTDFSHYGDALAAYMVGQTLWESDSGSGSGDGSGDETDQMTPAAVDPKAVHLYFVEGNNTEYEYEGVYLLAPKWHDYECAYDNIEGDEWDPGKDDFRFLVTEQTSRTDIEHLSFFDTDSYTIRSRSEEFNRASYEALQKDAAKKVVDTIMNCYNKPYSAVDDNALATTIAFNQLVPSWDMYVSSEYAVIDGSTEKCSVGPIWDREIEAADQKKESPQGFMEANRFWNLKKSKVWNMVDYRMATDANGILLNKVKTKVATVHQAHNKTQTWINNNRRVLEAGADRWHLPGNGCFFGWDVVRSQSLEWGNSSATIPGIFDKLFEERKAWLEQATSFNHRTKASYNPVEAILFVEPRGALPFIIVASILLGGLLIYEVAAIVDRMRNTNGYTVLGNFPGN